MLRVISFQALCLLTIVASAGLNSIKMIDRNFPPTQFLWKQPEMFNPNFIQVLTVQLFALLFPLFRCLDAGSSKQFQHHIELYIKPQYRIGPYIIGLVLGYYLANYQRLAVKPTRSVRFIGGLLVPSTTNVLKARPLPEETVFSGRLDDRLPVWIHRAVRTLSVSARLELAYLPPRLWLHSQVIYSISTNQIFFGTV